jgi:hypothetical protein
MIASPTILSRLGQRLLQIGAALLLYSLLEGFAIPHLASPRIGLSVHTLSAYEGVLLLVLGLVWPRLALGNDQRHSRVLVSCVFRCSDPDGLYHRRGLGCW